MNMTLKVVVNASIMANNYSDISPAVLGPVPPDELGVTLPHEHLLVDMTAIMIPPNYGSQPMTDLELALHNMGKIRQFP